MNKDKITIYKKAILFLLFGLIIFSPFTIISNNNNNNNNNLKQIIKEKNNTTSTVFSNQIITEQNSDVAFYFSSTGSIFGIGNNQYGTLGTGGNQTPTSVLNLTALWNISFDTSLITDFTLISNTIFTFLSNGEIWGWGRNDYYQLGIGNDTNYNTPEKLNDVWDQHFDISKIENLYMGYSEYDTNGASFAFLDNGEIWGWGKNTGGELGRGDNVEAMTPERLDTTWNQSFDTTLIKFFAVDSSVIVVLSDNTSYGWGPNKSAEMGNGTFYTESNSPLKLDAFWGFDISKLIDIKMTTSNVLAFLDNGEIWGWGLEVYGNLGLGASVPFTQYPTNLNNHWDQYFDPYSITDMYFGYFSSIVSLSNGEYWGWGNNNNSSFGIGTSTETNGNLKVPTRLDDTWINYFEVSNIQNFNLGKETAYVVLSDGSIYVWGNNANNQLGSVPTTGGDSVPYPELVLQFTNFNSQWNGGQLEFSFEYNESYWGTNEQDMYYTIYTTDINSPILPPTIISNLNTDGTTTTVTTSIINPDSYNIQITSQDNNKGLFYIDTSLATPEESFVNNVSFSNITTDSVEISYTYYAGNNGDGQIQYTIDNGNHWVVLPDIVADQSTNSFVISNLDSDNIYTVIVAPTLNSSNLSNTSETTFTTNTSSTITNLVSSDITANSALISYDYTAGNLNPGDLEYSIDNENTWVQIQATNNNGANSFTISNLNSLENYTVILRPLGEDNNTSETSFTTTNIPSIITNLVASDITTNSALISYEYTAGNLNPGDLEYSLDNENTWVQITATNNDGANSFTINDLNSSTNYTVILRPLGEDNNTLETSFITNIPSTITNLDSSDITTNSALISYDYTAGNLNPGDLEYSIDNENTWVQIQATNNDGANSFTINDLNSSTNYTVTLRPLGEDDNTSQTSFLTLTPVLTDSWWDTNSWWMILTISIVGIVLIGTPVTLFFLNRP